MRAAFRYLRNDVQTISRNTAKADVLKLYRAEKKKIKNMLQMCCGRVSLTSNLWTSLATNSYLALTVHLIDKNWILQKYVLALSYMPSPHIGVALENMLYGLLVHWGIIDKLSTITSDNASSNDACVGILKVKLNGRKALALNGEFFHVRCCAHILNLIM